MEGKKEGAKEKKKVPCHGIITVTGDLMGRFVAPAVYPSTHPSFTAMKSTEEEEKYQKGREEKRSTANMAITIFHPAFFPPFYFPFPFLLFPPVGHGVGYGK